MGKRNIFRLEIDEDMGLIGVENNFHGMSLNHIRQAIALLETYKTILIHYSLGKSYETGEVQKDIGLEEYKKRLREL